MELTVLMLKSCQDWLRPWHQGLVLCWLLVKKPIIHLYSKRCLSNPVFTSWKCIVVQYTRKYGALHQWCSYNFDLYYKYDSFLCLTVKKIMPWWPMGVWREHSNFNNKIVNNKDTLADSNMSVTYRYFSQTKGNRILIKCKLN